MMMNIRILHQGPQEDPRDALLNLYMVYVHIDTPNFRYSPHMRMFSLRVLLNISTHLYIVTTVYPPGSPI